MLSRVVRNAYACYFIPWMAATARYPIGRNIFTDSWDICVILDACRVDALQAIASEYDFLTDVSAALSVGSSSKEWMVNTFRAVRREQVQETVYLTGNGWAQQVFSNDPNFAAWTVLNDTFAKNNRIVERLISRPVVGIKDFRDVIFQPLSDMNGIEAFDPEQLTRMAIQAGREYHDSKLLVHYMQPHAPYIHRVAQGMEPTGLDKRPIELLREGHDRQEVGEAYLDNLRYVLDNVEMLLQNVDGDVLLTADHGEMMGRGMLAGHAEGIPHPHLKRVPWVRLTANDEETINVDLDLQEEATEDIHTRLEALGYL